NGLGENDIVLGLVSPVGTSLTHLNHLLSNVLKNLNYKIEPIQISSLPEMKRTATKTSEKGSNKKRSPEYIKIFSLMEAGNKLRRNKGNDYLAKMAINKINSLNRKNVKTSRKAKRQPTIYIIRSLKHPAELDELRTAYGVGFYLLGASSSRESEIIRLVDK